MCDKYKSLSELGFNKGEFSDILKAEQVEFLIASDSFPTKNVIERVLKPKRFNHPRAACKRN